MRASFGGAAASYDDAAVLARETGRRLADRLGWVKLAPARMMDIGCATGDGIRSLVERYPRALPLAVDFSLPMLAEVRRRTPLFQRIRGRGPKLVAADVQALPLQASSLDLVWSNLMLHWLDDPRPAFRELHRVLRVGGLLTFTLLGPDTLKELRSAGAANLRRFADMHDIGDGLLECGFSDPVTDMEMITLSYARPSRLLADQRRLGVRDGLLGHLAWREWRRVFAEWRRQSGAGPLPASFEVIYGHAWKGEPRVAADGRAILRFRPR